MAVQPPPADQRIVIENVAVATVDANDTEYTRGHVVILGNKIESVGDGPAPQWLDNVVRRINGEGHLITPGLVNTHHHFYQWITRGLAQDNILFDWLVALYPTWARIDDRLVHAASQGSAAALLKSGCTTASDHHYVFPKDGGDILGASIEAVQELGLRFTALRGSMSRGKSDGGLPPDFAVEKTEDILIASEAAVDKYHDSSFGSMLHVAIAPCSPSRSPPT